MTNLDKVNLFIGILIIISRSPLIFYTEKTLNLIQKIISKKSNIKAIGLFTTSLGMVWVLSGSEYIGARYEFFKYLGYLVMGIGFLEVAIPSKVQILAQKIWGMPEKSARKLGYLSVGIGLILIWSGIPQ